MEKFTDAVTSYAKIIEWKVENPHKKKLKIDFSDPSKKRVIIAWHHPLNNHIVNEIAFGPDRMLYISSGDGGGHGDKTVVTDGSDPKMFEPWYGFMVLMGHGDDVATGGIGNAQNPSNIHGTLLRIDPLGSSSPNGQYSVPSDNPFVPGYI